MSKQKTDSREDDKPTGKVKKKTIAIDFDGVLHRYSKGWLKVDYVYDPPVEGAAQALIKLKEQGHKIYVFSVRTNTIYHKDAKHQAKIMADWLQEHGIPYDRIWTFSKPLADIYIDDRAIGFKGDWQQTMQEIATFEVWNRIEKTVAEEIKKLKDNDNDNDK